VKISWKYRLLGIWSLLLGRPVMMGLKIWFPDRHNGPAIYLDGHGATVACCHVEYVGEPPFEAPMVRGGIATK
jgi:hypothetical protein